MALRTTREELLKVSYSEERKRLRNQRRKQWDEDEEKRRASGKRRRKEPRFSLPILRAADKKTVDGALRPTTLLDFLYRLRVRSNYEDPTMFTEGPESANDTIAVHRHLSHLTSATLLLHEMYIRQLVGVSWLKDQVDDWLAGSGALLPNLGLRARRDLLVNP